MLSVSGMLSPITLASSLPCCFPRCPTCPILLYARLRGLGFASSRYRGVIHRPCPPALPHRPNSFNIIHNIKYQRQRGQGSQHAAARCRAAAGCRAAAAAGLLLLHEEFHGFLQAERDGKHKEVGQCERGMHWSYIGRSTNLPALPPRSARPPPAPPHSSRDALYLGVGLDGGRTLSPVGGAHLQGRRVQRRGAQQR